MALSILAKLNQTIEDTTIRLHDVSEHSSWSKHIYQSQILTSDQADHMDCASQCLYVDSATCQIFAFDPADNSCHLGYFSKTDGSMTASVTSRHVYVAGGKLKHVKSCLNMSWHDHSCLCLLYVQSLLPPRCWSSSTSPWTCQAASGMTTSCGSQIWRRTISMMSVLGSATFGTLIPSLAPSPSWAPTASAIRGASTPPTTAAWSTPPYRTPCQPGSTQVRT